MFRTEQYWIHSLVYYYQAFFLPIAAGLKERIEGPNGPSNNIQCRGVVTGDLIPSSILCEGINSCIKKTMPKIRNMKENVVKNTKYKAISVQRM